jgi:hypothetical protein
MSRRAPRLLSQRPYGVSPSPGQYSCWGGAIEWVDKTRYLGVTLDRRLTWSAHFDQVRKKAAQVKGVLGHFLDRSGLSVRNGVLLFVQAAHPSYDGLRVFAARTHTRSYRSYSPSAFAWLPVHPGTLATDKFTWIWEFILRRPHQNRDREF